jgi:aspartate 1-decarboxylase
MLEAANLVEYEKVLVVDIDNGSRFETYCISGPKGSGLICVNGAAARLVSKGDKAIIMSFCHMGPAEAKTHRPTVVFVDERNKVTSIKNTEIHGPA